MVLGSELDWYSAMNGNSNTDTCMLHKISGLKEEISYEIFKD